MKTFKEFLDEVNIITERYYDPNEKQPSGRTAVEKAKSRGITGDLLKRVERGADNKKWGIMDHPDFKVFEDDFGMPGVTRYHHIPSGTNWTVNRTNTVVNGRHKGREVHEVGWDAPRREDASLQDKVRTIHTAMKIWREHIAPLAPHGVVIHARPVFNESNKSRGRKGKDRKNSRARMYEKEGMGPLTKGSQYSLVGRPPSPRQAAGGAVRLKPITLQSRNLESPPIRQDNFK